MEMLGILIFGLISFVISLLPLLIIVLVVVWLVRRGNRQSSSPTVARPVYQRPDNQEYARGVREALERVQVLSQVSVDDLDAIERDLLDDPVEQVVAQVPTRSVATGTTNQVVELPSEPEYTPGPATQAVDVVEPEPQAQPASPRVAPPQPPAVRPQFSGINILLSLSSLLFVAAGIAFIASPFANTLKLTVLIAIVGLFYGGGLALHRTVKRLRPAAVAFIGTGLALIPFLGIAFVQYTVLTPETVWLIISLLGAVAYIVAALALNSQVVSYLAVAFMLSLVASGAASVQAPASGYFVLMIAVSLGASIVARLSPRWVPGVFRAPVEQTGNIVTPLALGACLLFAGVLSVREYELIFALTTVQYVVARVQTGKYWYEQVARMLAHVTLLIVVGDIASGNLAHFGIGFVIVALLQFGFSVWSWQRERQGRTGELVWLWTMLGLQVVAPIFWALDTWAAEYSVVALVVLAASSVVAWWRTKSHGFGFMMLYAGLVLPIACVGLAEPALSPVVVGGTYLVYTLALIWYRYKKGWPKHVVARVVLGVAAGLYTLSAMVALAIEMNGVTAVIGLVVLAAVSLVGSYVYKSHWVTAFVAFVVWLALVRLVSHVDIAEKSFILAVMGGLALVMYALCTALFAAHDRKRGSIALTAGHFSALVVMTLGLPVHFGPMSDGLGMVVSGLLLVWSLAMVVAVRFDRRAPWRRLMHTISYPIFYLAALGFAFAASAGWQTVVLAAGVLLAWEVSYRHRVPWFTVLANILTLWTLGRMTVASGFGSEAFYIACLSSAVLMYGAYWWFTRSGDSVRRGVMAVSAWVAVTLAWLASLALDPWWQVVALVVAIGTLWEISYTYRKAGVLAVANLALVWLGYVLLRWQLPDKEWGWLATLAALAAVFYALSVAMRRRGDEPRERVLLWSVWLVSGLGYLTYVGSQDWQAHASVLGILGAATCVEVGIRQVRKVYVETGIYAATIAAATLIGAAFPALGTVFYAHLVAASIAFVGLHRGHSTARYVVALVLLTAVTGVYALAEGGWYSLLFLVEQAGLAVAGVLLKRRWAAWWGVIGAVLAVFYYLRESPYLVFTLLGVLIVSFVIWRLTRKERTVDTARPSDRQTSAISSRDETADDPSDAGSDSSGGDGRGGGD